MTTIDLTQASVRPAGSGGLASRTAAGFVVLASGDGADLVSYVTDHQLEPDLIERLAGEVSARDPRSMAMLFTSAGSPYLLAWGQAVASVSSGAARFTLTPLEGQLLVHPLSLDMESTIVLSDGVVIGEPEPAPVNLAEGSIQAAAVVVDLRGEVEADWQEPSLAHADLPRSDAGEATASAEAAVIPASAPRPEGQPAAQGIVFADDIDEISDLIDPAPAITPSAAEPALDAGLLNIPATFSSQAAAVAPADPVSPDPQATSILAVPAVAPMEPVEPAPVEPAFDAPVVIPLVRSGAAAPNPEPSPVAPVEAASVPSATPEVPPEFRREPEASPAAPTPAPVAPAPAAPTASAEVKPATSPAPPMVLGVVCPQGHHNHPEAVYCSQCGTKMGVHQTTVLVNGPRPALGVLVVDDGSTFSINNDLVIGRDPASHVDVRGGTAGAMVLVDDTLALSRQHARIILDDWSVYVADLNSSNGTWLNRGPNPQEWMAVDAGTTVPLQPGDRIKVGGRVIQIELHHIR